LDVTVAGVTGVGAAVVSGPLPQAVSSIAARIKENLNRIQYLTK
jgi:hypothetical protein